MSSRSAEICRAQSTTALPAEIADPQADAQHYLGGALSRHSAYEVYPTVVQDTQTAAQHYLGGIGNTYTTYEVTET